MKYEAATAMSDDEILAILAQASSSPQERVRAVLSAVFHGEIVKFAGDVLIQELKSAEYQERVYLLNIMETFYGMWGTDYRLNESAALVERLAEEAPDFAPDTLSCSEFLARCVESLRAAKG